MDPYRQDITPAGEPDRSSSQTESFFMLNELSDKKLHNAVSAHFGKDAQEVRKQLQETAIQQASRGGSHDSVGQDSSSPSARRRAQKFFQSSQAQKE
jgi:hypothetical protein